MARLQTCCCGCSLQLGCRILAIIGLMGGALQAISSLATVTLISNEGSPEESNYIRYAVILGIGSSLFNIVICGLLLYGVNTKRKGFLLPWIIVTILEVVLMVIAAFVFIVLTQGDTVGVVAFFVVLGCALLSSYFIAVVISFYQEVSEGLRGFDVEPLRDLDKC